MLLHYGGFCNGCISKTWLLLAVQCSTNVTYFLPFKNLFVMRNIKANLNIDFLSIIVWKILEKIKNCISLHVMLQTTLISV